MTATYILIVALVIVAIVWIVVNGRKSVAPTQKRLFQSEYADAWLMADGTIHLRRLTDHKVTVLMPGEPMHTMLLTGRK